MAENDGTFLSLFNMILRSSHVHLLQEYHKDFL